MKPTLKRLLPLTFFLASYTSAKSYTMPNLNFNCLNCINGGHDFCSSGSYGGPVDPVSSVCCANMGSYYDSC